MVAVGGSSSRAKSSKDVEKSEDLLEVPDEAEVFEALKMLEKERSAVAEEGGLTQVDFATRVRGRAVATLSEDAGPMGVQGVARTELARQLCARRGLQHTFKCTYSVHGRDASGVLSRAWCHRMQFFLDFELASEDGEGVLITDDIVSSYGEPTELASLDKQKMSWATRERLIFIRNLPTRLVA